MYIIYYFILLIIFLFFFFFYKYENYVNFEIKLINNFLTKEEIDIILNDCKEFSKSTVVNRYNNGSSVSNQRTSTTCFFDNNCQSKKLIYDKLKKLGLNNKIESLQLTKYDQNQFYKSHYDFFEKEDIEKLNFKQRLYTIFVYIKNADKGGETYFEKLDKKFKPQEGSAILWPNCYKKYSNDTDYICFDQSLHGGLPVDKGQKIGLNIWLTH